MSANFRIAQLPRDVLSPSTQHARSLRAILRNLGFVESGGNCKALRQRLQELELSIPAPLPGNDRWANPEHIQEAVAAANSYSDVLRALGLRTEGGNIRTLKRYLERLGISDAHLKNGKAIAAQALARSVQTRRVPLENILTVNSTYDRSTLKRRLLKEGLLKHECAKCHNVGNWLGEPLVLELEHKNGDPTDNRLCNLELLCPNCHSQTPTYSGRNNRKKKS
jgi:5-methylcytosine-specific restriction endonuclease McrA